MRFNRNIYTQGSKITYVVDAKSTKVSDSKFGN